MQILGLFSGVNVVMSGLNLIVNLVGAMVALILLIRRRNGACLLALIGFGISALIAPVLTIVRWVLLDRLGVRALVGITVASGLVGVASSICLVIAFWLALRDRQQPGVGDREPFDER